MCTQSGVMIARKRRYARHVLSVDVTSLTTDVPVGLGNDVVLQMSRLFVRCAGHAVLTLYIYTESRILFVLDHFPDETIAKDRNYR